MSDFEKRFEEKATELILALIKNLKSSSSEDREYTNLTADLVRVTALYYSEGLFELKPLIVEMREALESISSKHKTRHSEESYWQEISHKQCAEVLATDTKLARKTLAKVDEFFGPQNKSDDPESRS